MADNRIYVYCRWCKERKLDFSLTLMRFSWGDDPWQTGLGADDLAKWIKSHMHDDEPEWWSKSYVYQPFEFEYEDTNEEHQKRKKEIAAKEDLRERVEWSK